MMTPTQRNDLLTKLWAKTWTVEGVPLTGEQVVMGYHHLRGGIAAAVYDTGNGHRVSRARQILKKAGLIYFKDAQWWREHEVE
jgi:hypothetical protein